MKLKEDLYYVGIQDYNLRIFDIIMYTKYGTSYNSYLLKGSEKTALIETCKATFLDQYLKNIEEVQSIDKIDYLIVNHTEPDHTGSIEKILELNPNIVVVGTSAAIMFLKNIVNKDFKSLVVNASTTLSLGNKTLNFILVPNLHWPDTMYTYLNEDNVLFTCDSFGSHFTSAKILLSAVENMDDYHEALKYYFDNIIGPFKNPYMSNALTKIADLKIDMICTGHGPVLDCQINETLKYYHDWCQAKQKDDHKLVVIPYVSSYGYTKKLAYAIKEGLETNSLIKVKMYDMVTDDEKEVMASLLEADGFIVGSPTILQEALEPITKLLANMNPVMYQSKLASAFGSYGWSGEAVPHLIEREKQLRLKVLEGYKCKFNPSNQEINDAIEFGRKFAEELYIK